MRVVQACRVDPNERRRAFGVLAACKTRAAFGAETALVLKTHFALREMITGRALRELERFFWHEKRVYPDTARGTLAVAAMTLKHFQRFSIAFVPNRTARAAT